MGPHSVLIVEDEADLAEPLADGLRAEGFEPAIADTGSKALKLLANANWKLVVLDLLLPDISGESVLAFAREQSYRPSVLVLTARGTTQDKLSLFRMGCDDYLTKPYAFEELLERLRALLRRSHRVTTDAFNYRDLELDPATYLLSSSDSQVLLTPKEASMLRLLMENAEHVVSRRELLHGVWGLEIEPDTNFIGVHLFNLRKKLGQVHRAQWLRTIRNSGFVLSQAG